MIDYDAQKARIAASRKRYEAWEQKVGDFINTVDGALVEVSGILEDAFDKAYESLDELEAALSAQQAAVREGATPFDAWKSLVPEQYQSYVDHPVVKTLFE